MQKYQKNSSGIEIFEFDICDSTNTRAREYAAELLKMPKREKMPDEMGKRADEIGLRAVFVAERQTAGRGRRGRSFLSERGGIYASFLYFGDCGKLDIGGITARAAVVAARAVESVVNVKIDIKWVNDLYINSKKVAGILTEGEFDEEGNLRYFVVGMGINVYKIEDFEHIMPIATTLEDEANKAPDKGKILGELIGAMEEGILSDDSSLLSEYKSRCNIAGRSVTVHRGGEIYPATVLEIADDYSLKIVTENGEVRNLNSGEVSIRL